MVELVGEEAGLPGVGPLQCLLHDVSVWLLVGAHLKVRVAEGLLGARPLGGVPSGY